MELATLRTLPSPYLELEILMPLFVLYLESKNFSAFATLSEEEVFWLYYDSNFLVL